MHPHYQEGDRSHDEAVKEIIMNQEDYLRGYRDGMKGTTSFPGTYKEAARRSYENGYEHGRQDRLLTASPFPLQD